MKNYFKLIRDKQLMIFDKLGIKYKIRILEKPELYQALVNKLYEEVSEFAASGEIEELGDIVTVVESLAELRGFERQALYQCANSKDLLKGRFDTGIFLETVEEE